MCAENLLKKAYTEYEFVLGKDLGNGEMYFVRGCKTEEEMRELYRDWLIQSDQDSEEHWPFQRYEGEGYIKMLNLAFEVRGELDKKTKDQGKQYIM